MLMVVKHQKQFSSTTEINLLKKIAQIHNTKRKTSSEKKIVYQLYIVNDQGRYAYRNSVIQKRF